MRGISKRFPGVLALSDVNFDVLPGEVHALVGENGAGKSTLIKILAGVYTRDSGDVIFRQKSVNFTNPRQAQISGITTIYQELNQVAEMSITENIFMGDEIERRVLLNWPEMHRRASDLLAKLHMDIDPRTLIKRLGVAQQQMVEVARALHHKSELIIMDEPTSALSLREIEELFGIIRELKESGVSIIYISHHLDETFAVSDRITVLRDGRHIATEPTKNLSTDSLIRLMVGRDLSDQFPKEAAQTGKEMFRIDHLKQGNRLVDISFSVYAGEILGIAGLVGAGRTELVRAIFGADMIDGGTFFVEGRQVRITSPRDAIRHGIGLLTEDRKQQGLVLQMSVRENTTLAVLERLTATLLTNRRKESELTQGYIKEIAIKTPSEYQAVGNLSGGNQQKVVLGKWIATKPKVLIFDEPTRGIDVGAKVEIYKLMNKLAAQGVAILMVSSELPEILGMSDRVMVIREGRITGTLTRAEATQQRIMELATGSPANGNIEGEKERVTHD